MDSLKLSIVIPVYNSEECLPELTSRIELALSSFSSYELILIEKTINPTANRK